MANNESETTGPETKSAEEPKRRVQYRLIKGGGRPAEIRRYPQRRNSRPNPPEEKSSK